MAFSTRSIVRTSAKRPWLVVAIWLLAVLAGGFLNAKYLSSALTNEIRYTNNPESKQAATLREQRLLGPHHASEMVIVRSSRFTAYDPQFQAFVRTLRQRIAGLEPGIVLPAIGPEASAPPVASKDGHTILLPLPLGPRGQRVRAGIRVWPVNGSMIKEELYRWLHLDRPTDESGSAYPPGYCHFPKYGEEYFKQITAEQLVTRVVKGYRRGEWQKTRDRNEALDCRVYARAAAAVHGMAKGALPVLEGIEPPKFACEAASQQRFRPNQRRCLSSE